MLQFEKFFTLLKLSIFTSFFLYNLSWFLLIYSQNIVDLLRDTFLDTLSHIIENISLIILPILNYLFLIFFVICLLTFFIIFVIDILSQKEIR